MFRVSVHPYRHYAILRLVLTVFPVTQYDWTSPYSPRPIRIHIIRRTGATKAGHPFLGYPWYDEDFGGGIAWGVLASPNLKCLLGVLKRQHVEDPIQYPRYLIGATGLGASALRRQPSEPLPLSELIFLYNDEDIRVWLLANPGKDPLDLLVLEARQDQGEDRPETPTPASGGHPFFDRKAWERWVESDDIGAGDGDDDDDGESLNGSGSGSQEEDNADHDHHSDENVTSGAPHAPDRRSSGIIQVDEVSVFVQHAFLCTQHLDRILIADHTPRMTMGTANRRVGTPQGVIILPPEIPQADGQLIHDTKILTLLQRLDVLVPAIHDIGIQTQIQRLDVPAIQVSGIHTLIHRLDVPAIHDIGIQTQIQRPDVLAIQVSGIHTLRHPRRSRPES
jgi:hypothetical protein